MNQYFSMFTTPQAGDIFISWALIHDLSCWERIMRMKTKHWKRVTWLWRWAENWLKLSPNMKLRTITWGGSRPDDGTLLFPKTTTFPWFHISICYWRLLLSLFELRKQNYNMYSTCASFWDWKCWRVEFMFEPLLFMYAPKKIFVSDFKRMLNKLETPFLWGGLHNVLHILQLVGLNLLLQRPEIGFELFKRA